MNPIIYVHSTRYETKARRTRDHMHHNIYSRERFYVCAYKLKSFYNSSLIAAYVRANHSEYCMSQCTHCTLVQLASTQFKALEQREHKVYSRTLACHLHASRARALISSSKGSMDVTRVSARECQVKLELYRSRKFS